MCNCMPRLPKPTRTEKLEIRVTPEQAEIARALAETRGESVSEMVRVLILEASAKARKRAG